MKKSLLATAVFLATGLGHGGIYNYTIDGVDYPGHYPWAPEDGQESIQRRWWPDPILDVSHPYLACNRGNPLATHHPMSHAPVRAGATITARYTAPSCPENVTNQPEPSIPGDIAPPMLCAGPEYQWVHYAGPLIAYMAACNGLCSGFDATGPVWFKIYESGLHSDEGETQTAVGEHAGWSQWEYIERGWNVTIPRTLKPGNYLIRHEVINIASGAPVQLYPECAQLSVSGDGNEVPGPEYLVSFPGAYSWTDPGIQIVDDVYSPKGHATFNYTIPGPKIWTGEDD